MNKIYRLVWSEVCSAWVAVAETTKGHKKSAGRRALLKIPLTAALVLSPLPVFAVDVDWATQYPSYLFPVLANYDQVRDTGTAFTIDNDTATANHFASGTVLNILGPIPSVAAGSNGTASQILVRDGLTDSTGTGSDPGRIISIVATDSQGNTTPITSANIDTFSYSTNPSTPQQNQELNVVVPGLEGNYSVIKVYDSTTFSAPGTSLVGDLSLNVFDPNSFHIYNNFGIADVQSVGGTANINIGADTTGSTPIAAAANTIELLAKNSVLAKATATDVPASSVNWISDNYIHFAPASVIPAQTQSVQASSSEYDDSITLPRYAQVGDQVIQLPSVTFDIHSAADIAKVNDFLLGQGDYSGNQSQVQLWLTGGVTLPPQNGGAVIDSPTIAQSTYNAIIQSLLSAEEQNRVNLSYYVWDDKASHTNNATLATGDLNVIYATGANASGTVTGQGSLAVDGASAVMRADSGATLTNNGSINTWRSSSSSPTSIGMLTTNATANNTGTINAGLFIEKDGTNQNVSNQGSIGMQGNGASTLTNTGIINTALTDGTSAGAIGIDAKGTTTATNSGSVALVGNVNNPDGRASGYGVSVSDAATFTNLAGGNIFIGSLPVSPTITYAPVPMVGGAVQSAGIYSTSSGQILNEGTITLGAGTRNAVGMLANGATGQVINNGTINVLGLLTSGAAASNYGLSVIDTQTVTNNGRINVYGDNNAAINLLATSQAASVDSTAAGVIVVGSAGDAGGSDNNPYTYRNYAVYAEGVNGQQATATIDSNINLFSAGAIGVHARGTAQIDVGTAATLTFSNSNQIGYYAYGQDATINLGNAVINDNGQAGSILFLIDHGATFDGNSGTGGSYSLTVTGNGSKGVFANGFDSGPDGVAGTADDILTTLNTGTATITVAGENAVGVKLTGGATGIINNGGIILDHDDTTGVVIDGRTYTIDNQVGTAADAIATSVTSNVALNTTSAQSGIKGYDVSYKGQVTLSGTGMSLAGNNNIGLYLHNGGIGINNAPMNVSGTGNIGVYIQDQGTLTNTGDITVSGAANSGNVGVKVQGAGAQVTQLGNVTANGGLAAVQLTGSGASLAISGTSNHITAGLGADGILMDTGSSSLSASNTTIDISGSGAGINNKADTSNINLSNVTINASDGPAIRTAVTFNAEGTGNQLNVSGSGAGFAFENADGSNTTGKLTIGTGYTIDVTGANGNGILAKTSGSVTSGANITMGATSGSAISAVDSGAVTNNGNIQTSSNTNTSVLATNASAFTNTGTINSTGTFNPLALIRINGSAANRTILNTGTIADASQNSVVIDASGGANNTVTNQGTLSAASNTATALLTGSGSDNVTLSGAGQNTTGLINLGSGTDTFIWNAGTLNGAVDFTGADGNDHANIGKVDITSTNHILSEGGINSTLTFTDTHAGTGSALIGSLAADDLPTATNIGSGWSTLAVAGASADVRVVDNLQLSGTPLIQVTGGATLRSGDNVTDSSLATINNYNVATDGADSLLVFDGTSATHLYSGIISGSGGLERATGGTTVLTGENTYTGNTLIDSDSTLQLGNGGTAGALSAQTNITDNGVLTINQSDTVNLGGVISGTGAFHQIGTGVTRLSGNNSYQAETQVTAGTLLVNGNQSAATGATTVASGATLGGKGTLGGDVTFAANTTLTPGDNGAGTLAINGNLVLSPTTSSQFELGQVFVPGGALNDLVTVGGNLTLDGDLKVSLSAGGLFMPGVYRLFNYSGALTNNTLNIASLPPGNSSIYSVQTSLANQVNLVLGFESETQNLEYWDGAVVGASHGDGISGNNNIEGGSGVWSALSVTDSNNWTTSTGAGNAPWAQQAFAIFQGTGGTVDVSQVNGVVVTSGMQFDADGYVLNGDPLNIVRSSSQAPLVNYLGEGETPADAFFVVRVGAGASGAGITTTINDDLIQNTPSDSLKFLKYDPGRLILTGNNTFTGGTVIYGGTLNVSADQNLGLTGTSVLINNDSTLQIGADYATDRPIFLAQTGGGQFDLYGHTFTPAGVIGGLGQLTVLDSATTGNSLLVLNRANTYQGDTTVTGNSGATTVAVDANVTGAFGKADSTITVNQQGTVNFNDAATAENHQFTLDSGILKFNDTASAASSVTTATNGAVIGLTGNASGGAGQFTLTTGTQMNLSGQSDTGSAQINNTGLVTFAGQAQAAGATIANNAGGVVNISDSSGSTTVGSVSGAGDVVLGAALLREGALNLSDSISGIISGAGGSLTKIGSGILTLTGDNTYTGSTSVDQGVLLVNGNQQAATGNVAVAAGSTLGGNGTLGGNVTVADNGHLAAGADLNSVGVLTMSSLTLNQNAQIDFQFGQSFTAGGSLNDLINVNGDLNLNGKLNITQTPGGTFDVGIYRVLNYTGALTDNTLDIGTAPEAADDMYVQTSIANQVNLVNRTGVILRFWDGAASANKNDSQIEGGDGIWQNSSGNDNWSTDVTTPDGRFNAPFSDNSFAIFGGTKGNVTVDNSLGAVMISGAQFATDGYVVSGGTITTNTADTQIRVGDGTAEGADYVATINSVIAGTGGIDKTDAGKLILTGNNTYSGGTQISAGTLQVAADNNLGLSGGPLGFNGGTLLYAAAFDTARNVSLQSGGGTVNTNGNNVAMGGVISGSGALTKTGGGTLTLTGDNTYTGVTTLEEGNVQLGNGGDQGSITGNIIDNTVLQINRNNLLTLPGNISGTGQVWQQGSGTTVLSGSNTYSGITLVQSGTLMANGTNTLSANSSHVVSAGALLDTGGTSQTVSSLVNQGTINLRGGDVGSTLTVNGDYVGMNGTLKIAAQQHSPGVADRLVMNGGTATGKTLLDIDVSQLGEQTTGDGITVVEAINGATTTAQTTKDAFTIGADHLEAGAFEYRLFAGNAAGAGEDWFLRASYRPEVAVFNGIASTARQADLAVLGTLHLRVGDEKPYDANVPEDQEGRFWARYIAQSTHQSFNDATGTQADSRMNGMQAGVDLYQNENWRAGVYTTVLDIDTSYEGANSGGYGTAGYTSDTAVYLGGYATWTDENGFYVDNVLQYGRHSIDLTVANSRESLSPDGNTYIASVETGRPFYFGDSSWAIEPQAQLIYQHSDFDSVIIPGDAKTRASINADDAVIGRLGVRLSTQYDTEHGKVKPYVRVNLWQELSDGQDTTTFQNTTNNDGKTTLTADQRYSSTEIAMGATWAATNEVQAYTEVGKSYQNGGSKSQISNDLSGTVGVKIRF